jgi:chemotaxis protein methyltransferase CheR
VRVTQELRQLVTLRPLNLLESVWPMRERFDAIFCRNVLIYFDKPTQIRVVQRLAGYLAPGGLLFVGHSENFTQMRDCVELVGKTVYRAARQPQGPP